MSIKHLRIKHPLGRGAVCSVTLLTLAALPGYPAAAPAARQATAIPAFPGAEGAGSRTPGGRGGAVYEVTNLNDSGPGSLRDALSEGNRIVVFRVAGTIDLQKRLDVAKPNLTIAGQTAPGDGICLRHFNFNIKAQNVVVHYLRVRLGNVNDQKADAITIAHGARQVILDHCTATWSVDEALSLAGDVSDVTVQWCLIAEALRQSKHAKGAHGYGSLARANGTVSLHHNLWAHNDARNPRLGDNYGKAPYPTFDVRNNVVYDYGATCSGLMQGKLRVNYVANFIRPGPSSTAKTPISVGGPSDMVFYLRDNVFEGNDVLTADNSQFFNKVEIDGKRQVQTVAASFLVPLVPTSSAREAYETVLATVGASLPARDAADARIIRQVKERSGQMIDSQAQVGGWPELKPALAPADSDHDGMTDAWETKYGLHPNNAADGPADDDKDGYTNVEEYLNNTNPHQYIDYRDPRHNVDVFGVRAHITHGNIAYGKAGDESLLLDASVPEGKGPFPVVILVHGGGWGSGDKQGDISALFKPLAEADFTWFSINYRLAPENRWPGAFQDVQTAIRWVKAHAAEYKGDPGRIALIGYSAGGQLITLATVLAQDDTRIHAVVGISPPTDLVADTERRGELSLALRNLLDRATVNDEVRATLHNLSPINYVKPGLPPFLLIHGTADKSVPYAQSVNFQQRLAAAGVPCDLITIQDAPHAIADWEKIDAGYKAKMVAWLQRTLGGARAVPTTKKSPSPPTPTDPFAIATDPALYGKRVSQQIPAIARVGQRWFCAWYGGNKGAPGTSGEGSGCYNILAMSDDECKTWNEIAYFIPNPAVVAQSIIDPRLTATPEGALLLLIPVSGQKGRQRSLWSVLLKNPLAKGEPAEPFVFGAPAFVDFGFVGSPALIGGQLYFTANQNASGSPPWPAHVGMKLHRVISFANDQIKTERIAALPYAATDGSLNTFFETSLAQTSDRHLLACFRTTVGQYMTRSSDGGKTWSTPIAFTAHPNARNTKADLARSPSGRLVLAFNRSQGGRINMCVALSSDGGETWPHYYVFDARSDPGTSYPNIAFGADARGNYDGMIYVAYDHGRGKIPPSFTKEITIAQIPESRIVEGNPTSTRHIVAR